MTGIFHFETFLLTGILLNLTPGNDTIFILTKSIGQGKKAGVGTGCWFILSSLPLDFF
jgi:threonine/homoserine/homoserine lactone efflux protein